MAGDEIKIRPPPHERQLRFSSQLNISLSLSLSLPLSPSLSLSGLQYSISFGNLTFLSLGIVWMKFIRELRVYSLSFANSVSLCFVCVCADRMQSRYNEFQIYRHIICYSNKLNVFEPIAVPLIFCLYISNRLLFSNLFCQNEFWFGVSSFTYKAVGKL